MGSPEAVAEAVSTGLTLLREHLELIDPDGAQYLYVMKCDYVTGQTLYVDGGLLLAP
jgi:hypothetical protein